MTLRQFRSRSRRSRRFWPIYLVALGLLVSLFALSACTVTGTGGIVENTPTPGGGASSTATAAPEATSPSGSFPVLVYFSKHPESDNNVNAVYSVNRVSPTSGVARFALQQLIAGPTASEKADGFYTELTGSLSGASNCGGDDFQLYPDHKGTTVSSPGTMTVKFCRTIQLAGDLTGSRIATQISTTILQFSNVHKVIILNKDGGCFNDFQGANACLN